MVSSVRLSSPNYEAVETERPPPALASHLLEEILLRVASPVDLARASTACVSFRRLITDRSFLHRYRSIHPPLLLGFVSSFGFHPVHAPHPTAAVARAVARAADFSFDYLPRLTRRTTGWPCWYPCDVHNGRILVRCPSEKESVRWDLAVCNPLSRRYLLLPPITDDLLASVEIQGQNVFQCEASFIGIEEDTSFSVILWMQSNTRLGVLVFSSVSGCWSVSMSSNRDVLGLGRVDGMASGQCLYDCFYWKVCNRSTLIKLDINTMQFCAIVLLPSHHDRQVIIVESGRNKVAMFSLNCEGRSVDYYTFSQNGSENSREWHMMSTIPLPAGYTSIQRFRGPAQGYIFLEGLPIEQDAKHLEVFSLEIKSFKIEVVSTTGSAFSGHPYFGFSPSMSPTRFEDMERTRFPS